MRFIHTKCGGEIDTKKRMCLKCKKKWNPIFFLSTNEIRPMVDKRGRPVPDRIRPEALRKKAYASWADKLPGVGKFAGFLPKWPRWARILITIAFILAIILIVLLIRRFLWSG